MINEFQKPWTITQAELNLRFDYMKGKITLKQYEEEKTSYRKLAEKYGISKSRIGQIINKQGWTKELSDTQRYKCLGNAVTVNVVKEIIRLINLGD